MNETSIILTWLTLGNVLRVLMVLVLIGYLFFAFFLYLRLRILSYTLRTGYSGVIRYAGFLHLIGVLVIFVVLGILVWLI